VRPTT